MLRKLFSFLLPRFETAMAVLNHDGSEDEGAYVFYFPTKVHQVEESEYLIQVRYLKVFNRKFRLSIVNIFESEEVLEETE